MNLDKAIQQRHSVRKFSNKKPNWRKIIEALDFARLAPLAGNISTLKFIFIDDKKKIQEIGRACQQNFVADVDYIVVVCSKKERNLVSYDERGERYIKQQAGAAIENFLLKITDFGLATCWVGAFADNPIKKILNIPDNIDVEALFPIGYELGKSKQRIKPDLDKILYFNKWGEKKMVPVRRVGA